VSVVVIGLKTPMTRTTTEVGFAPVRSETVTLNVKVVVVVPPLGVTPPFTIETWPHVVASTPGVNVKTPMTSQPVIARAPTSHDRDLVRSGRAITD
jgi:hypothetical protein